MALCASFLCCTSFQQAEEDKALAFLAKFNNETPYEDFKDAVARYATNITEHNKQLTTDATITFSSFQYQMRLKASKFDVEKLKPDTKRQILFITSTATPKDKALVRKLTALRSSMLATYSTSKVEDKSRCLSWTLIVSYFSQLARLRSFVVRLERLA